jgi:hypothetical protein
VGGRGGDKVDADVELSHTRVLMRHKARGGKEEEEWSKLASGCVCVCVSVCGSTCPAASIPSGRRHNLTCASSPVVAKSSVSKGEKLKANTGALGSTYKKYVKHRCPARDWAPTTTKLRAWSSTN